MRNSACKEKRGRRKSGAESDVRENRAAERVAKYKRPVSLDPMPASERRIIHSALQSNRNVVTESQGEEPNRCVVVKTRPYVKKI